jgi:hypothetical protein
MSMITVAIIAGSTALIAGGIDFGISKNKEKKAAEAAAQKEAELKAFQDNRQEIIDNSDDVRALAAQVNNPFANLSVATGAAEFEAEQADLALAQSLDTMAATGASAGGATALARAALASKKGISNSIQQQEAQQFQQNLELQYGLAAQDALVGTVENVGSAVAMGAGGMDMPTGVPTINSAGLQGGQ